MCPSYIARHRTPYCCLFSSCLQSSVQALAAAAIEPGFRGSDRDPVVYETLNISWNVTTGEVFIKLTHLNRYLADFWFLFSFECQALSFIKLPIFHFLWEKKKQSPFWSPPVSHVSRTPGRDVLLTVQCKHVSAIDWHAVLIFSLLIHTHTLLSHLKIIAYSSLKVLAKGTDVCVCVCQSPQAISLIFISW